MKEIDFNKQLVPFGKYKGQPVSVMQNDTQYCDWLATQDWFRERYANVYNQVIINNFTEPTETPEHNRLQMLFLDDNFLNNFCNNIFDFSLQEKFNKTVSAIKRKYKDVKKYFEENEYHLSKEVLDGYTDFFAKNNLINGFFELSSINFEQNAFDVVIEYKFYKIDGFNPYYPYFYNDNICKEFLYRYEILDCTKNIYVEIKPCLGDDFPAVLRQIKANLEINIGRGRKEPLYGEKVLIIDEFTAKGATFEQVKKVFELSDITLLKFSDIQGGYINAES